MKMHVTRTLNWLGASARLSRKSVAVTRSSFHGKSGRNYARWFERFLVRMKTSLRHD